MVHILHMETTTIKTTRTGTPGAAIQALAVVGFVALIIAGMALAIYAARFVPAAVSNIGSAAVYLSSQIFPNGDGDADLVIVPPTDVISFGDDTTTGTSTATTTVTTPVATTTPTGTTPTQPGTPTTVVVPIQVPASVNYHGLPDLVIEDVRTGYLTSANTSSFRASNVVPGGERGAVKFAVVNRGTNVAGSFRFEAELPTSPSYTYKSSAQQALRPGERIEYVLGFDRTRTGDNRTITIEVDSRDDVTESNERNNTRTITIDIER